MKLRLLLDSAPASDACRRAVLRSVLIAVVALASVAETSSALAAYNPRIKIASGAGTVTVGYRQSAYDEATAKVALYSPPGLEADLTRTVGTTIGTASAVALTRGQPTRLDGVVVVGDEADRAIVQQSQTCTGRARHAAVWAIHLRLGGIWIDVPAFVDQIILSSQPEIRFSSIQLCFRSPYVPTAGQPIGIKPLELSLRLRDVFVPMAFGANFAWTGNFVPYTPGTDMENTLAAVENQSIAKYPILFDIFGTRSVKAVTLNHRRLRRYWVTIGGELTANGNSVGGARVEVRTGAKTVATTRTDANGVFSKTIRLRAATTFTAHAVLPETGASGECAPLIPESLIIPSCAVVSLAGIDAISNRLTVGA